MAASVDLIALQVAARTPAAGKGNEMKESDQLRRRNGRPHLNERGTVATRLRRVPRMATPGLCSDCAERLGCNFSTTGHTVWQCEKYRADEE